MILVAFVGKCTAFVHGPRSRDLIIELSGRPPVWVASVRSWTVQPHRARDLLAMCQARRWPVEVVSEEHLVRLAGYDYAEGRGRLF